MNILQSFLSQALQVPPAQLLLTLREQLHSSPFADSLMPVLPQILQADSAVQDELWKFSVSLNLPHQLLCDAYWLQQRTGLCCQLKVG